MNTVEKQFRVKMYTQCKIYTQYKKKLKHKNINRPKDTGGFSIKLNINMTGGDTYGVTNTDLTVH